MDEIEHTILELLDVPMEDWPEWMERRKVSRESAHIIAERLIGGDSMLSFAAES